LVADTTEFALSTYLQHSVSDHGNARDLRIAARLLYMGWT